IVWSLIHSFWIGILLSAITYWLDRARFSPRQMLKIRMTTLLTFLIGMVFVIIQNVNSTSPSISLDSHVQISDAQQAVHPIQWLEILISSYSTILAWMWMAGVMLGLIKYLHGYLKLDRFKRYSHVCNDELIIEMLHGLISKLDIKNNVQLRVSALINSPATVGWIKPIIYLPVQLATGLSTNEIHTILHHELVHIKRYDYLINLILVGIETLFFFNPFVLLMIRKFRNEMEFACDQEVVSDNKRKTYISALLKLQELRPSIQHSIAAKSSNTIFKTRINKMMNNNNNTPKLKRLVPGLIICLFSILIGSAFMSNEASITSKPLSLQDTTEIQTKKIEELKFKELKEREMEMHIRQKEALEKEKEALALQKLALEKEKQALKQQKKVIKPMDNSLKKAEKMMKEIQQELIKDGILNENKKKVKLKFQYSDLLNGKEVLGDKYEKYKKIFNEYFPRYDSYATTRIFKYE
ncbi:MAG: M56 family metallopeptidase, partial [Bacteroidota bacterium]